VVFVVVVVVQYSKPAMNGKDPQAQRYYQRQDMVMFDLLEHPIWVFDTVALVAVAVAGVLMVLMAMSRRVQQGEQRNAEPGKQLFEDFLLVFRVAFRVGHRTYVPGENYNGGWITAKNVARYAMVTFRTIC
jgi:NADH:ubiquinone oxidoreductase subunit 6 (subunit J)